MMKDNKRDLKTNTMPKTKAEFLRLLKLAFLAGCEWGYGIDVSADPGAQENIGASFWAGEITLDAALEEKERIIVQNRPDYF